MANWTNPFPSWGDTGANPGSGFQYQGGDQVNEKHIDYLWDQLNKAIDNVLSHTLQDDGSVAVDDGATAIPFTSDAGANETLFDMSVTAGPAGGTEQSVQAKIDGTAVFEWYAEADGSGGIQNPENIAHANVDLNSNDLVDGGTTIWNNVGGYIEQTALENDSLTVAGNSVSLGGSTGIALGDLSNVTASGEGSGNGFDADTVDGSHASAFANSGHSHALGDLSNVTASGEGSGNGFDADTVDGSHASDLVGGMTLVEDANSPFDVTASQNLNLASSYTRLYLVFNNISNTSGGAHTWRVNNDTQNNYDSLRLDGSLNQNDAFQMGTIGSGGSYSAAIMLEVTDDGIVAWGMETISGSGIQSSNAYHKWTNHTITSAISSIQLTNTLDSGTVEVYGK